MSTMIVGSAYASETLLGPIFKIKIKVKNQSDDWCYGKGNCTIELEVGLGIADVDDDINVPPGKGIALYKNVSWQAVTSFPINHITQDLITCETGDCSTIPENGLIFLPQSPQYSARHDGYFMFYELN